jgi:hypothetical protein
MSMTTLTDVLKQPIQLKVPEWLKKMCNPPITAHSLKEYSDLLIRNYSAMNNPLVVEANSTFEGESRMPNIFDTFEDEEYVRKLDENYFKSSIKYTSHYTARMKNGRLVVFDEPHGRYMLRSGHDERAERTWKPLITLIDRLNKLEQEIPGIQTQINCQGFLIARSFVGTEELTRDTVIQKCKDMGITPFI